MSKTFRRAAMSTICMLIVAVMSLTGATYAWFTAGDYATVSGMKINVDVASGGVEVSGDNGTTWGNTLVLSTGVDKLVPVSSADGKNFFDIEFSPSNSTLIKSIAATDTTKKVLSVPLQLRNTGAAEDVTVNLNYSTIVAAVNKLFDANNDKTTDIYKAARLAVLKDGAIVGGIYSPDDVDKVAATATNAINAASGNDYFTVYTGTQTQVAEGQTPATVAASTLTVGLDAIEITLPKMTNATTYNPVSITVVIWLEGQDTDAVNANAGGAFDISLNFQKKGTTKTANPGA